MTLTDPFLFAAFVNTSWNIFLVVVGLGLVIFFHELGHFAVAKWCDVHVERFSLGFGPILWSFRRGETEYALSLIPFGGYVKMLGQDDLDPSQLSSDEIAEDPRAYSAKSVPKRMAIISAGVVMNVVTGMLFYAIAFGFGVEANPPVVGAARVGMPAWRAGMRTGDEIVSIDGNRIETFTDVIYNVALSHGDVEVVWKRPDGTKVTRGITPDGSGTHRRIGVVPTVSTTLVNRPELPPTLPGTPAARAEPPFEGGDRIRRIDDEPVADYAEMHELLAARRDQEVTFYVQRAGAAESDLTAIKVGRNPFRTLGMSMEIGEIAAVRRDSPADRAGLEAGDKITNVDGKPVGVEVNPMRLPDLFEQKCRLRESVTLTVLRPGAEQKPETVTVEFQPDDPLLPAWSERPSAEDVPLSVPSLGIAFHMIPKVISVDAGSPAEKAGIKPEERLIRMVLTLPEDAPSDRVNEGKPVTIPLVTEDKDKPPVHNWAFAFWQMQSMPTRNVTLTVADKHGNERDVDVAPVEDPRWSLPFRGIQPEMATRLLQATGPLSAVRLGFKRAKTEMFRIYQTIASLLTGRVSYKELAGPVEIGKAAYKVVAHRGLIYLLMFLGFLSINLAVLNFLPIPVLDGGHMVFLLWEAVTRKKPSERVVIGATYVGLALVLGLMCLVLYLDLFVHRG